MLLPPALSLLRASSAILLTCRFLTSAFRICVLSAALWIAGAEESPVDPRSLRALSAVRTVGSKMRSAQPRDSSTFPEPASGCSLALPAGSVTLGHICGPLVSGSLHRWPRAWDSPAIFSCGPKSTQCSALLWCHPCWKSLLLLSSTPDLSLFTVVQSRWPFPVLSHSDDAGSSLPLQGGKEKHTEWDPVGSEDRGLKCRC